MISRMATFTTTRGRDRVGGERKGDISTLPALVTMSITVVDAAAVEVVCVVDVIATRAHTAVDRPRRGEAGKFSLSPSLVWLWPPRNICKATAQRSTCGCVEIVSLFCSMLRK